jgi:hypothetical protein
MDLGRIDPRQPTRWPSARWQWAGCLILVGLVVVVIIYVTYPKAERQKEDRAKMDCKVLAQAVTVFHERYGFYPETLAELAKRQADGSPALLNSEKALNDPWGNPYLYTRGELQPKTGRPLIWSNGPPGQDLRISSWD